MKLVYIVIIILAIGSSYLVGHSSGYDLGYFSGAFDMYFGLTDFDSALTNKEVR
jgi:hypothetical protein